MIIYNIDESEIERIIHIYGSDILASSGMLREKLLTQHGRTSCYAHSVNVAHMSVRIAMTFGLQVDRKSMVRGALLHDYFLYDWHVRDKSHRLHGFFHPRRAYENARRDFDLNDIQRDAILRHMFPLTPIPPKYTEGVVVTISDKVCAIDEIFVSIGQRFLACARLTRSIASRLLTAINHN